MAENFHNHITPNMWTPISPEINQMDYYIWGVVERNSSRHPHNIVAALGAAVVDTIANIPKPISLLPACGFDSV